ncbi:MAG: cadmium-translocating P-type ATPase [Bacilli bacterium]|nr:cadmium-translocating P-type ATPase [Bacilli bacterium]
MREKFNVYGMHCAMCSSKIEKKLNSFNGVKASVKLDSGEVVIDYNPDQYKLSMFKKEIKKLGYKCDNSNETFEKVALVLGIVITIFFLVGELRMFGLNIPAIFNNPYLGLGLASIVLFTLGLKFYYHAFFDIKNMSLGMDVLVCLGVTSAYGLSIYQIIKGADMYYFASVSMIITLVSIGKLIEAKVKHNTSYTVSMLSSKISSKANLIETDDDGLEEITEIEAKNVKIGDIVLVKQGETIPVDGVVVSGNASVDEAIISGESKPVSKKIGSKVLASTILIEGTIKVKVTTNSDETFISKVIEAVEQASMYKPPIERLTKKIANIFVPAVVSIAVVTFIIWLILGKGIEKSVVTSASVLLISCPCALGLATPMAILVGSNRSANLGILYKSGDYLEYARKIKRIYFDKTKTLTLGNMEVIDASLSEEDAIYLVSLEKMSLHPIAKAIISYYKDVKSLVVTDYENIPGVGIKGKVDGKLVEVKSIDDPKFTKVQILLDGTSIGYVKLADIIRDDSKEVIDRLKKMGISPYMLTGDNDGVAKEVASSLGIPNYHSSLNPIQKADIIKESDEVCGFVGDGINDAVALKSANVGFSVASGTDISVSASDVILLKDNLNLVCDTIAISKITFRNIVENLVFAAIYNIVMIPLACAGITSPVLSSIMMGLSNLLVVGNAIRIKYIKIK